MNESLLELKIHIASSGALDFGILFIAWVPGFGMGSGKTVGVKMRRAGERVVERRKKKGKVRGRRGRGKRFLEPLKPGSGILKNQQRYCILFDVEPFSSHCCIISLSANFGRKYTREIKC